MRSLRLFPMALLALVAACDCGGAEVTGARASLAMAPATLDFGRVVVGHTEPRSVVFSLAGNRPVELSGGAFEGEAGGFATDFQPFTLEAGATKTLVLTFHPQAEGPQTAIYVVHSDLDEPSELRIELKGEGVPAGSCVDKDGDTFGDGCEAGGDCDDANASVNPGQAEHCGNGLDDDCNPGTTDTCPPGCVDRDGDGFGENCPPGGDCDDSNTLINPNQPERCGNGADDDCNPATSDVCPPPCVDRDGDGYGENCAPGPDCDDFKAFVNPGQPERCGNVYDDDCNPATTDTCPFQCPPGGCGMGCADGSREGFQDLLRYPGIAACDGAFRLPGVFHEEPPACGRNAGNGSSNPNGEGCNASDLCAAGWHVCRHVGEVAAKSVDGCAGALNAPNAFFATRQSGPGCSECATGIDPSRQCGGNDCSTDCYPNDATTNDVFGCGTGGQASWGSSCGVLTRFGNDRCNALPAPWYCGDSTGEDEALRVVKTGSGGGGVLCCAD